MVRFVAVFRMMAGCLLVLLSAAVLSPASAQELDISALQGAAQVSDVDARRELGEALVTGSGGVTQDIAAGIALLEGAAAEGDVAAKAILGKFLLDGHFVPADFDRGAALLEAAAEAGNPRARTSLGVALLWGLHQPADPVRARSLLEQAAQDRDSEAMRVLGEQLVAGWVFERDVATGLPLLDAAIAEGDVKAHVLLGSLHLNGIGVARDTDRALALFEAAASMGDGEGLERFGSMLMWERVDPARAEDYLRRAGEMGRGSAWTTLAEGAMYAYLGTGSRAKFSAYAEKAATAGEPRVAVLEAQRRMWGISMRASGPATIAGLEEAASQGNPEALKFLISLVRDGNRYNIRKDTAKAATYLEGFADLLTPLEIEQFSMTIDAARTRQLPDFEVLSARLQAHPELKSIWFGKELFAANPNFAIYLLQEQMRHNGTFEGEVNGLATTATLRALGTECATLQDTTRCGDSVMHPDVIGALLAR